MHVGPPTNCSKLLMLSSGRAVYIAVTGTRQHRQRCTMTRFPRQARCDVVWQSTVEWGGLHNGNLHSMCSLTAQSNARRLTRVHAGDRGHQGAANVSSCNRAVTFVVTETRSAMRNAE